MSRLPSQIRVNDRVAIPAAELDVSAARSGGPGGQHVNKTSSKVLVRWSPARSSALTVGDRGWLLHRLRGRLTTEGDLLVSSETHRDQSRNLEDAIDKLATTLREALRRPKVRRATKPSRSARERRMNEKSRRSAVKKLRRRPAED